MILEISSVCIPQKFGNHLSDGSLDLLKFNFSKVTIISEKLHS